MIYLQPAVKDAAKRGLQDPIPTGYASVPTATHSNQQKARSNMVVIQINQRVCDFHSEEEQKNLRDISSDLSPCEGCGMDLCKFHKRSIKTEGWKLEKPSHGQSHSVVVGKLVVGALCPDCMEAVRVLRRDFLRTTPGVGYPTDV